MILFYRLGGPALFEPDEGRNAEKAREILVLNDWITPHENFNAVLDKPIFFYWLIALSYKIFGVSEWAARLPSALAAFGCIVMVYFFVRRWWGEWEARWSVLVLVTSAGFFVFSRLVIFDMTLTAFIMLALCAFYHAAHGLRIPGELGHLRDFIRRPRRRDANQGARRSDRAGHDHFLLPPAYQQLENLGKDTLASRRGAVPTDRNALVYFGRDA